MVSYWKEPQETGELCSNKTFRTDTRLECHVILTCYQTWFSLGIFFNHCKIYIKSSYLIILYDKPYKTWQGLDLASGLQFADPGAKTHAPCGHGSVTGCNCSVHPCWHIAGAQDVCVGWTRAYMTTGKTIDLTKRTFVGKVMSLLSNMLSSCPSISPSLLRLIAIELMMPSNHLILCHPLFLLPSIFPSIRVFSNESALLHQTAKFLSVPSYKNHLKDL